MTATPSQPQAVAFALFLLGGAEKPVDTEDIAMKVHELDPTRFPWRKYPSQINLELVRVALSDAAKDKKDGRLTSGSGARGWTLTREGLAWAQEALEARIFEIAEQPRIRRTKSRSESQLRREHARLLSTDAWMCWSDGKGQVTSRHAREVFRVDSYTSPEVRTQKIVRMIDLFQKDQQISLFLDALADAFGD